MEKYRASATSLGVAGLRAAHQLLDNEPLLLYDPIILQLLGPSWRAHVREHPEHYLRPEIMHLRSHVVLRSRWAEDRLNLAYQDGIRQYLLLGAGLDTFAWRQPIGMEDLRVFELDHPATQAQKLQDLTDQGFLIPDNLTFVPADLETVSLREALDQSGFDLSQPCFISWLGVMVYLSMEAIDEVLSFVASLPAGSRMVFTFTAKKEAEAENPIGARAAALGEPWKSFFSPEEIEERLRGLGFSSVEFLRPEEAWRLYFSGRTDALPAPRRVSICEARI